MQRMMLGEKILVCESLSEHLACRATCFLCFFQLNRVLLTILKDTKNQTMLVSHVRHPLVVLAQGRSIWFARFARVSRSGPKRPWRVAGAGAMEDAREDVCDAPSSGQSHGKQADGAVPGTVGENRESSKPQTDESVSLKSSGHRSVPSARRRNRSGGKRR